MVKMTPPRKQALGPTELFFQTLNEMLPSGFRVHTHFVGIDVPDWWEHYIEQTNRPGQPMGNLCLTRKIAQIKIVEPGKYTVTLPQRHIANYQDLLVTILGQVEKHLGIEITVIIPKQKGALPDSESEDVPNVDDEYPISLNNLLLHQHQNHER